MVLEQQKQLYEKVKEAMDGRTVLWLSHKAKLNYTELTRKVKGSLVFSKKDIDAINEALGTSFTLE